MAKQQDLDNITAAEIDAAAASTANAGTPVIVDTSVADTTAKPAQIPLADALKNVSKDTFDDTTSALDKLAKAHEPPAPTPEQLEEAEATKAEEAAKKSSAAEVLPDDQKTDAPKVVVAKVEAVEEPSDKLATVKLPPYSKPASVQAFNEVKRLAREESAALTAKLKELEAKIPKSGTLPVETAKELDDLRKFRKTHDYRGTKEFVDAYVKPLSENEDRIFGKLKSAGFTDSHIADIKKIGINELDWDAALAKAPSNVKRSIEAILLENETLSEKRDKALKENENNAVNAEAASNEAEKVRTTQEMVQIRAQVDGSLAPVDWVKDKVVPVGATAQQRTDIEFHNSFAKEQRDRLESVLATRNSPETFADLAASALFAYEFKRQAQSFRALYTDLKGKYDKIVKAGSTTRVATGAQPATRQKAPNASVGVETGDALDALRADAEAQARE